MGELQHSRAALLTAAVASLLASSCCLLPLALAALGLTGAWLSHLRALQPYSPFLIGIAIAALALASRSLFGASRTSANHSRFGTDRTSTGRSLCSTDRTSVGRRLRDTEGTGTGRSRSDSDRSSGTDRGAIGQSETGRGETDFTLFSSRSATTCRVDGAKPRALYRVMFWLVAALTLLLLITPVVAPWFY